MAGCFGDDPIDRHLENQLNRYLDEQDASSELFETRYHEGTVTGWFTPEGEVIDDDDYVNFTGYATFNGDDTEFEFDTEEHDEEFISKYSKYIPTIVSKLQDENRDADNWEEEHDYDGASIKWVGGDLDEIDIDMESDSE